MQAARRVGSATDSDLRAGEVGRENGPVGLAGDGAAVGSPLAEANAMAKPSAAKFVAIVPRTHLEPGALELVPPAAPAP